ncbi:hypothetical protein CA267_016835 [Alteromonas pelagimontana]|uniref:Uncharacterized protein n=1 Tax=Alteromonas pelagimontana TaxID=1858656 RepID=A0A6M4MI51_9ALTE|nr:hypothetical protein [Alteromonas pelagimontana]QJR82295.1 hypothetical protein CA267_016835 [Alteromonas pelagimontana]
MTASTYVTIRTFDKAQLKQAIIFSGISPKVMRRVFGAWILFALIVGVIVSLAPDLSKTFIFTTFGALIAFTIAMFAQSRIAEGWPSIVFLENEICVIRDPQKREFICVLPDAVKQVEPSFIKPNKKAVAVVLDSEKLSQHDVVLLNKAVWPRDDRLLGLAHFIPREEACERIRETLPS